MRKKYYMAVISMLLVLSGCNKADNKPITDEHTISEASSEISSIQTITEAVTKSEKASAETTTTTTTTVETTTATTTEEMAITTTTVPVAVTETEVTVVTEAVPVTVTEKITEASTKKETVSTKKTEKAKKTKKTKKTETVTEAEASEETGSEAETDAIETKQTVTEETDISKETDTEEEATEEAPEEDDYRKITLEGVEYELSFEDNFDGNSIDMTKWEYVPEWKRQDLENYWRNENCYVDGDGNLVIKMEHSYYENKYYSGGVRTKGKFEQAYGYFEIRCKVNEAPGYWTAFWLMGECVADTTKGGVNGTEIDIMETPYVLEKKVQNSLNWDGYGPEHKYDANITDVDVYDGEYHTFSLLWTEEEYVYYIDGKESWRTRAEKAGGTCEMPLYLKITSETGSWRYNEMDHSRLPDYMLTDYVRVYRQHRTISG